jgi:integrase
MRQGFERAARLLGWTGGIETLPWHTLNSTQTSMLIGEMTKRSYSPSSVVLTLCAVKGVLHQAWQQGLIDREAFARATAWPRISTKGRRGSAGREIPQAELDKLAAYCRRMGPAEREWPASAYGAMLEAVFALAIGGALRATEVCRVPFGGRSPTGKPLGYIAATKQARFLAKGNKERLVTFRAGEVAAIERWLAVRAELDTDAPTLLVRVMPDGKLGNPQVMDRQHIAYLCKLMARGAGVERFTPHDCRRTFGTRGWRQVDGATLQRQMGHADISTTIIYDMRGEEEDAKAAREKMDMWPGVGSEKPR